MALAYTEWYTEIKLYHIDQGPFSRLLSMEVLFSRSITSLSLRWANFTENPFSSFFSLITDNCDLQNKKMILKEREKLYNSKKIRLRFSTQRRMFFWRYTLKKSFYVVSVSAFIFFILFVEPIRSLHWSNVYQQDHCSGCCLNILKVWIFVRLQNILCCVGFCLHIFHCRNHLKWVKKR